MSKGFKYNGKFDQITREGINIWSAMFLVGNKCLRTVHLPLRAYSPQTRCDDVEKPPEDGDELIGAGISPSPSKSSEDEMHADGFKVKNGFQKAEFNGSCRSAWARRERSAANESWTIQTFSLTDRSVAQNGDRTARPFDPIENLGV
jgi:hypothetical protein